MTKIKNTKKGMAKKTLSISLAVAMLATSNVPVWAAEFTDGTDAAFTSEAVVEDVAEVVEEAPVVEENSVEAAEEVTVGTGYDITFGFNGITDNAVVWNNVSGANAKFKLAAKEGTSTTDVTYKYVWKFDGLAKVDTAEEVQLETEKTVTLPTLQGSDAGKKLTLFVYAEDNTGKTVWSYTSDSIKINPIDETEAMKVIAMDTSKTDSIVYKKGEDLSEVIKEAINWGNVDKTGYDVTVSGDTKNVTDEGVTVTIDSVKPGYTGRRTLTCEIKPLVLDGTKDHLISENMVATLKTTDFTYTGNAIRVKAEDVTLKDKTTGEDLSHYLYVDTDGYVSLKENAPVNVGKSQLRLNLIEGQPEKGSKNYEIATGSTDPDGHRTIAPAEYVNISARDLSKVTVKIKPQSIPKAGSSVQLKAADVKFFDADGNELNLNPDTNIEIPKDANKKGTYDVKVVPTDSTENVTGETTTKLTLVAADLSGAEFSKDDGATLDAEEYTGEAIVKTTKQLGSLVLDGKVLSEDLYSIQYNKNVHAGTATLTVVGKGDFEGSTADFTFTINPAKVEDTTITHKDKVEVKDTQNATDYKDSMGIVVKAKNAATPAKEFTLTDGVDYTVKYSSIEKGVGGIVVANITITNKDFIKDGAKSFTVESNIIQHAIKSEYIKLKENDFTYTGSAIEPEFDIVVDGRVIDPNEYKPTFSNNLHAGTATLTVVGTGNKFNEETSATITFDIKPAKAEDLVGAIPSKEYKGYSIEIPANEIDLKLGDNVIDADDNFKLSFGENLNVGKGTVTLTPKNGDFTGTKTLEFDIVGKMLEEGSITAYDANDIVVPDTHKFHYDGTAHTYAKTVFTVEGKKLVEGKDYEFVYVDNVYGKYTGTKENPVQKGAVLVVAKGIYGGNYNKNGMVKGIYTDANGNKITNVVNAKFFEIEQETVNVSSMTVSNGTYAGGLPVKPVVDITVKGVKLVEGKDYDLDLTGSLDLANATVGKPNKVTVNFKNGYKPGNATNFADIAWGIDKFDLANADVSVKDGKVVVKCGKVDVDTAEYTTTVDDAAGTTTITAVKDSKNYTGSKTVNTNGQTDAEKPEKPMITDVKVTGNKATVVLSGESDGATGYDYVISKDKDCITNKDYAAVNRNRLTTTTDFTYVEQGTYYAYCHSWKRVNGVKVFSDWSNAYPFVVSAITPSQPTITSVKVKGSTVTVTYTKSSNADGYDVVLGSKLATVAGERRPVEYGTLVKKNIKGNTVTATFKNVKKGTYYAGLHAFNRTSEDGKKVFSPWSYAKKVTVK